MEQPVDRQVRHLARHRPARGPRLRAGGLDRDVDLPQEDFPRGILQIGGLGEGKREDVGRAVGLEEIAVQDPDPRVVGEDQGDGGAGIPQPPERGPEKSLKSGRS